jgi:hypothetical protein
VIEQDVLVFAVRPTPDCAKAVERRDTKPRGEVPVRAAADRCRLDVPQSKLARHPLRALEEAAGEPCRHWRAVRAAEHLHACPGQGGCQCLHGRVNPLLLFRGGGAHVDRELAAGRDRIGRCAGLRHGGGDGGPEPGVAEHLDREDLSRQLDRGVDTCLRLKPGMRRAPADDHVISGHALTGPLQPPAGRGALEHEHGGAGAGLALDKLTRCRRTDLLVAGDEQRDPSWIRQRRRCVQRHDDARLHVEAAGSAEHGAVRPAGMRR